MAFYSIRPIALAEGPRDSSDYTYRENFGVKCDTACYIWYIEGSDPGTIVDAGANIDMFRERKVPETEVTSILDGLTELSLKPEDIGIVIVTHLHWDHIALGSLFKNAKFIVQKSELDYAVNPHPVDAHIYDKKTFAGLNFEVIEGQKEIMPGISVFPTPGHTPGGQSVEVSTESGKAVITGFCSTLNTFKQTDMMKRRGWEVSAPLIHNDVREAYDSVLEVKRRADIILPLHDPAFINKKRIPE